MRTSVSQVSMAVLAALATFTGLPVHAQSDSGSPAADAAGGLQEVTVFAQKRNESVQDIPVAVTVISASDIANQRLDDSNDLQNVTPNLTIGSVYQGVTPQLTLRGVGVNDGIATTAPSVGTYIDQLYMGNSAAAVMTMFDIDRVEVLRGPQGTLYGKNTNGGALNLYTARPTNDFTGEVDLEAGNYQERSGTAFISGPLVGPQLTGRVSVFYKDRNGYGENLAPGPVNYSADELWAEHSYGVRAELQFKPNDDMDWLLIGSHGQNRITYGWPVRALRDPNNLALDCANPFMPGCVDSLGERVYGQFSPYGTIQSELSYNQPETTLATLQGNWNLGAVTLTSITGYINTHVRLYDHAASDYIGPGQFNFDQHNHSDQYSEEFRVASTGRQRFNYTAGLYASSETRSTPVYYGFDGSPGFTTGTRTANSYAAFGQADFAITDTLKVTGGLRYSKMTLDTTSVNLGGFGTTASHSWGSVGGRFSIEQKLNETTQAYASYNRGFKEGNINIGIYGAAKPGVPAYISPEFIDAFEVGIKSDIDRHFRVNADVFYNKLKDMQVAGTDPTNFNFPTLTNAARATTYGAELEVIAHPTPDLQATINYGYLHARFDNYYVLSVLSPAPDFPAQLVNASGKPIPLSPTHTFSGDMQYRIHLSAHYTLEPRINFSYKTVQAFTPEGNLPRASQPGYGLLGAGLKLETPADFEVDLWGRNLTNKAYMIDSQPGDSFLGTDFLTYGTPRMYGVTLRKRF